MTAWRWWLLPALVALALALIFADPFLGEWDALDYTVLAVQGRPSSMILGRSLFIFTNHGLWRTAHALFNLPPEKAYLLFKYGVIIASPLTIIAWWLVARDLTNSVRVATLAALVVASSPFYIIYSGQVMTEIPSLLLLAVALVVHLKGLRSRRTGLILAGAALLGTGANIREAALLYAPWLILAPLACGWKLKRREITITAAACLSFLICAFGLFAFLLLSNIDSYRLAWYGWVESSRLESARHPITISNIWPLLRYFFIASPLVLVAFPAAAFREWKRCGFSPLLALAIVGLIANLSLIVHYSVVINGRYMLTGIPALAPLAANYFQHSQTTKMKNAQRAFVSAVLGILFTAVIAGFYTWPFDHRYVAARALAKDYRARLSLVPRDGVMIAGAQTVAVTYWRGIGVGEWDVIGTGAGWPSEQLFSVIETYLKKDRRVFLDIDPRWWSNVGWQRQETRELVGIESQFRFRRISDTIYEIRPADDETADDRPNLRRLLSGDSTT